MEGYSVLVAGNIGLSGTAVLARAYEEKINSRFPKYLARATKRFDSAEWMRAKEVSELANQFFSGQEEACYLVPLGEGGILTGLWTLAKESGSGFLLDQRKIPIRQETIEICELLEVNPYHLSSEGSIVMMCREGELLKAALEEMGITAVIVGHSTKEKAHILMNDDVVSHLNRPQEDELVRLGLM